jgi:hypothetical protein
MSDDSLSDPAARHGQAAGEPTQLTLTTQPSARVASGEPFPQQPSIQIRDANGKPVSQEGVVVIASIATGGEALGGSLTARTNASGLATFVGLSLSGPAGDRTLRFQASGLAGVTSNTITVTAGVATQLAVAVHPSWNVELGVPFPQQPAVQLRDRSGNPVSQAGVEVMATVATGEGTLGEARTATTDERGMATFAGLCINGGEGIRTVRFTAPGLTSAVSNPLTAVAGVARGLALATQPPPTVEAGMPFRQQPAVQIRDGSGNPVPKAGVEVTAKLDSGEGSLGGTLRAETDPEGVAEFEDLSIVGPVGPRTLVFSAGGLTEITADPVTVTAGRPVRLALATRPPSRVQSGVAFNRHPEIELLDASGNRVRQAGIVVMVSITEGEGKLWGTLLAPTNEAGVATFPDLEIAGPPGARTLEFSGPGLGEVTSSTVVQEESESSLLVPAGEPVEDGSAEAKPGLRRPGVVSRLRTRLQALFTPRQGPSSRPVETRSKDVPQLVFGGSAASIRLPEAARSLQAEARKPDRAADPGAGSEDREGTGPVQRATLQMLPGRLEPMNKDVIQQEVRFLRGEGDTQVVTLGWDMGEPPSHVTLDHPSIQPRHAKMTFREGRWWIQSLSEFYPVEVNDVPLQLTQEPVLLENGDRVRFGEAVFRFWMS